jgi:putative MFS transporter
MGASLPVSSSLLQETVPARWKGALACLVFSGFNIGEFFAAKMGVIAFAKSTDPSAWLFLVAALPAVATFIASLAVPESPRFLAARGDTSGVANWFKRACFVNRRKPEELFPEGVDASAAAMCTTTPSGSGKSGKTAAIKDKLKGIFKPGGVRLRTLVLWTLWSAANAAFYGMIFALPDALRHVKDVSGDKSFDIARGISQVSTYQTIAFLFYMPLVALNVPFSVIFPFTLFGAFASLGYATLVASGAASGAGGSLAAMLGPLSPGKVVAALAISKFFYNGIFMMLYPLTGTSYPTAVRATGTALAGTFGRICTIMVPPVCIRLQSIAPMLPYTVFTTVSGIAFLASLLL